VVRVIVVGHHLSVPGTEEYWNEYKKYTNHEVCIVRPRFWKEGGAVIENEEYIHDGIHFKAFNAPFSRYRKQNLYFFQNILRYFCFLRNNNPDFIYVMNTTNSLICLQTVVMGKLLGVKVVGWASRLEPRDFFKTFGLVKGLVFSALRFLNIRLIDGIHATSKKAKDALIAEGHICPIYVAPTHGIPSHFERNSLPTGRSDNDIVTVGYVGELLDFKGVDILIEAIVKLPVGKVELLVAGVGPEEKALRDLASKYGVVVHFLGYVDNQSMPTFYTRCDVVVLPSKGDGLIIEKFGRVLIEAAGCGCAVVGSNVGGIPLAVGEEGLMFSDGSSDSLGSILESMLDPDTLSKEKIRCHRYAMTNFSMEVVATKFINSVMSELI
jgi:glycosyltransferase involved in cell wall biosynthesis